MIPPHVIIIVIVALINGGIAIWKKSKERAAKAEAAAAARSGSAGTMDGPTARPGGAASIDGRIVSRRATRDAGRVAVRAQAPSEIPPVAVAPMPPAAPPMVTIPAPAVRPVASAGGVQRAPAAPPAMVATLLADRARVRRALLLGEVLGPPRATVPFRPVA